jgi:4-amino-4-deoxy-L-arabinose transferase-like glycosyltransferase
VSSGGLKDRQAWLLALFALLAAASYLHGLDRAGLLGPDEPRYAAIARAMATGGDWLTPRLWGEPWFEKPPLLYWLAAAAFRLGLGPELAPRAPLALLSALYLVFHWLLVRRLLDLRIAWASTLMLATGAGWAAYSMVGVTDLPLAVFFNGCLLLMWLWSESGSRPALFAAAACLAAAVLAKGLVPLVLLAPLLWLERRRLRECLLPAALFLALAAPWFAAMAWLHGRAFLDEFFLRHHLSRFASGELRHVQPFWFYFPVLIGGIFPWILAPLAAWRPAWQEKKLTIPAVIFIFGFLFFSVSKNKLPGYLLPLLPSFCLLCGAGLARAGRAGRPLFWTVMLAGLSPSIAEMLPGALLYGIRQAEPGEARWQYFAFLLPAALAAWWLDSRGRRLAALALAACVACGGLWQTKRLAAPALDELVSARGLWRKVQPHRDRVCILRLHRTWRYGLAYYAGAPLPDCSLDPRELAIDQPPGALPRLVPRLAAGVLPGGAAVE